MSDKTAKVRLVITLDGDVGISLTGPRSPVEDILPGGMYEVECASQERVVIREVDVSGFSLVRIAAGNREIKWQLAHYVADAPASETYIEPVEWTGGVNERRRYRFEPPLVVEATESMHMRLKNDGGWSLKPKIAMFVRVATAAQECVDCRRIAEADGDILPPACPAHGGSPSGADVLAPPPTPAPEPPPPTKRNPLDPHQRIAAALGATRVCQWCAPHFRARLEYRPSDHTRCNDFDCGCHCQDRLKVN